MSRRYVSKAGFDMPLDNVDLCQGEVRRLSSASGDFNWIPVWFINLTIRKPKTFPGLPQPLPTAPFARSPIPLRLETIREEK